MSRRERTHSGGTGRGPDTTGDRAATRSTSAAVQYSDPGRRASQPFPRPLSTNGLRSPDGPLVARRHVSPRVGDGQPHKGRVGRFVAAFGWRALAIPGLAVLTFVTLLDVASTEDSPAAALTQATATPGITTETTAPTPTAEGEAVPVGAPPVVGAPPFVEQGSGTLSVVAGTSQVYGTGPLRRFLVEVEDGINVDGAGFAAAVEATLADPRGWGSGGEYSFQRVDGGDYDFRVSLVSPLNVESFCPGVGTGGYTSCRYGERAVINLARWETAVPDYAGDVATYRLYVVNHEVGHALGNGHQECPGPGELAPVMQQQTLGLDGCVKNPWPYPNA
ncbi:MAG: DUF3152 domain-containing protein [Actinomycetota bacterium]|nr:DUF3152 domain-containing protein [Actinomycetota bacterium]